MQMENSRLSPGRPAFPLCAAVVLCLFMSLLFGPQPVRALVRINNTKHNLSVTGPGPAKSLTETRICIFCHTPHNAKPDTPLWNHQVSSQTYSLYTSSTLLVAPSQPTGPTKLCLSCHDGTVALGAVINPLRGAPELGQPIYYYGTSGSLSSFGADLSGHHPVVFSYSQAQQLDTTGQLVGVNLLPTSIILGGAGNVVHCTSCHDPHDDTYGDFLVMDNRYSALCTSCHQLKRWAGSGHATSVFSVVGILPRLPKTFPAWSQMNEWGCEVCHTPHFAATAPKLLNFSSSAVPPYTSAFDCTTGGCHGSASLPYHVPTGPVPLVKAQASSFPNPISADIKGQINKKSAHHELPGTPMLSLHQSKRSSSSTLNSSSCVDCHNPHASNRQKASAPNVSGMLEGVSGVDANGLDVDSAQYEYEVCFKCHSDYSTDLPFVPRIVNTINARLAFAQTNPSYHPVITIGKERNIPSIPSTFEPTMTTTNIIYCTDCHRDDEGVSKGPHGSAFSPILRERYETADNTPENYQNYALCYRCHSRESILRDDSFRKNSAGKGGHSGHLAAGAPCSACHDPHGINDTGQSGSHTHLINFDSRTVLPAAGNTYPLFTDGGTFSGSCTLICHGKVHNNESYPQGGLSMLQRTLQRPINRMRR